MASVRLEHVTKRFRDVVAINDLTLEVKDKEFLVLVGPSGCGKTTALRLIAGLEEVTEGRIYIGDRCVNDVSPKDRDIAMVFQNYALYPHMTVFDNMAFGLKLRRVPKEEIRRRVEEVAAMLDLQGLMDRKPKQLSGGQRQRVALGRAIVREPKVFLMDEPLSNLDAKLRVATRAELIRLHRRLGVTTIYVTHDQVEAMTMGQRIAVLNEGVMQQCDTPMNLYNKPANLFVASFIGSPSMNLLPATIEERNGKLWVSACGMELALTEEQSAAVRDYVGREVIFGVRPEDIYDRRLSLIPERDGNVVCLNVDVIEPMGDRSIVYATAGDKTVLASVSAESSVREGERFEFLVDMAKCHVFDKDTERAVF